MQYSDLTGYHDVYDAPSRGQIHEIINAESHSEMCYFECAGGCYVSTRRELLPWGMSHRMVAFNRNVKRSPLPVPWGMSICYIKSDGTAKFLSDWETRQLAQKISEKRDKYANFNIYRSCISDVIFYGVLLTLLGLTYRRGKRIADKESLTRERMERLARLCAQFKECRGRLPQSLDEATTLDASETVDAIFQRPFLYGVVNDEEFLL